MLVDPFTLLFGLASVAGKGKQWPEALTELSTVLFAHLATEDVAKSSQTVDQNVGIQEHHLRWPLPAQIAETAGEFGGVAEIGPFGPHPKELRTGEVTQSLRFAVGR